MTANRPNLTKMVNPGTPATSGVVPKTITYSAARRAIEKFRGVPRTGPGRLSDAAIAAIWDNLDQAHRTEYLKRLNAPAAATKSKR